MRVGEVMTTPVLTVDTSTSAAGAWEQMVLHHISHLVVVDAQHRPRGVLSAGDLGGPHGGDQRDRSSVADLMTEKLVVATPATTIREAANLMRGNRVNCLPVFERGRLAGIVTSLDLLALVGRGVERPVPHPDRPTVKHRRWRRGGWVAG